MSSAGFPAPPENWAERIAIAKEAREMGKQLRADKPVTFQQRRPFTFGVGGRRS